jgi:hypothetical protein
MQNTNQNKQNIKDKRMNPSKAKAGLAVMIHLVRQCQELLTIADSCWSVACCSKPETAHALRASTIFDINSHVVAAEKIDLDDLTIVSFSDKLSGTMTFAVSGSDAISVIKQMASTIGDTVLLLLGYRTSPVQAQDFIRSDEREVCIAVSAAFGMTLQEMHASVDTASAADIAARLKANGDDIADHMRRRQGPNAGFRVLFFPSFGLAPLWFLKGDDAEEAKRIIEIELQGAWPPSSEGVSITVESWFIDPQYTRFVRPGTPSGSTALMQAICILRSGYVHAEGLGIQAYRRAKEAMDAEAIQRPNSSWSDRMHYFAKHMMASRPGLVFTEHDSRWAITVLRRTPVKDEETKK